ncbi:MAG: glycogen/starch/alpha-glucan phosphorylase, partial [bacterium]|nr:glycogen/starch/alpha-glucan phosphorylase [bacterium]
HSKLLKKKEFPLFNEIFPRKFINETNGITQRKWLLETNPKLAQLITKTIGNEWITNLDYLKKLLKYKNNLDFLNKWSKVKYENKLNLIQLIKDDLGLKLSPDFMIDSQIKRMHEYKRQFLNILQVIDRYNRIIDGEIENLQPKIYVFAGKAHPNYTVGKEIITLINDVAKIVNNDKRCKDLLKVVFIPNYNIDKAQIIISATELSEQISTAGKEASGTGNMKFALNGALTIGTLDGANVEIKNKVGSKNIFIFGLTAKKVYNIKERGYDAQKLFINNPRIQRIIHQILTGAFSHGDTERYTNLMNAFFNNNDEYMLLADFESYVNTQLKIDMEYQNKKLWWKKSIINTANSGFFSSDRTIKSYAKDIWKIKEIKE